MASLLEDIKENAHKGFEFITQNLDLNQIQFLKCLKKYSYNNIKHTNANTGAIEQYTKQEMSDSKRFSNFALPRYRENIGVISRQCITTDNTKPLT